MKQESPLKKSKDAVFNLKQLVGFFESLDVGAAKKHIREAYRVGNLYITKYEDVCRRETIVANKEIALDKRQKHIDFRIGGLTSQVAMQETKIETLKHRSDKKYVAATGRMVKAEEILEKALGKRFLSRTSVELALLKLQGESDG